MPSVSTTSEAAADIDVATKCASTVTATPAADCSVPLLHDSADIMHVQDSDMLEGETAGGIPASEAPSLPPSVRRTFPTRKHSQEFTVTERVTKHARNV